MFNIQAAVERAAAEGPNMTEAVGGGDFPDRAPAAEGLVRLRLIGYIEIGDHAKEFKGEKKTKPFVKLQFELSGPKHPPLEFEGRKSPQIITLTETLSLNEKANFFKLFKRLNYQGKHTHFAQMLGEDFLGTVHHNVVGEGADKKTYANLRDDAGYTIRPPFIDVYDEATDTTSQRRIPVDKPLSPLRCFLWNFADKPMWDSLFIDGSYEDKKDKDGKVIRAGTSKNYWQNLIRSALNFKGSPAAEILFAGGEPDLPESETPERDPLAVQAGIEAKAGAAADPLAGV
jgi:hypothetical protein